MSPQRRRTLQLPLPPAKPRTVFRRKRQPPRWRQFLNGLLFLALGSGLLLGLLQLPGRLNATLVISEAIRDLIRGLSGLMFGGLKLLALVLLVLAAVLALLLLVGGVVRLFRALWPRSRSPRSRPS